MEKIKYTTLDGGTIDERIREAKDFFGLSEEQTFQDLEVDDENDNEYRTH